MHHDKFIVDAYTRTNYFSNLVKPSISLEPIGAQHQYSLHSGTKYYEIALSIS